MELHRHVTGCMGMQVAGGHGSSRQHLQCLQAAADCGETYACKNVRYKSHLCSLTCYLSWAHMACMAALSKLAIEQAGMLRYTAASCDSRRPIG